jgi:hypothetical protein
MDNFLSQFLFVKNGEKRVSPSKSPKCPRTKKFSTVCDYNILPDDKKIDVDDYDFKFKSGFLNQLAKLYDKIKKDGDTFQIDNVVASVSPKLFIRDILTDYTVNSIFENKSQNILIHIINRIMNSFYDQFYKQTKIRLYFVYRGGNILKMYKNTFENILPGVSKKIFKDEFDPYFKNSDLDFYTVIEGLQTLSTMEILAINDYIQMMCYYGLYIARNFIMNNFSLFEYCKYNKIQIDEDFEYILNVMNEKKLTSEYEEVKKTKFVGLGFANYMYTKRGYDIEKILNMPPKNILDSFVPSFGDSGDIDVFGTYKRDRSSGRSDLNITPEEDVTNINKIDYQQPNLLQSKPDFVKMTKELVQKNKLLEYYITNNNEIYNKEEFIDFSLVRMMINFTLVYERNGKIGITNAPSELYDLSIGRPEDKMYKVYTAENIVPFEFEYGVKGDKTLTDKIYIPSIQTTILDLIFILFEYRDYPWLDTKYEKRLYRLMILIFVVEMSKSSLEDLDKILKSKKQRKPKDDYDNNFETILYRNKELQNKVKNAKDKVNFKNYIVLFNEIRKKLIDVVQKLKKFVDADKKVEKNQIYDFVE